MRLRIVSVLIVSTLVLSACSSSKPDAPKLTELQRTKSGDMDVVLLAQKDAIPTGKSQATLEFQTGADHRLVDVGTVKVGASMEMARVATPSASSRSSSPGSRRLASSGVAPQVRIGARRNSR